ncbi:MAG TPA: hypothetical protein VJH20_02905 [Candidatus Nanoarchaeia archaeon]|nr:hypothetical protein [Candidatus Nanoarchaeia archaeon]
MKKGTITVLFLGLVVSILIIFFIGNKAIVDAASKVNATFITTNTAPGAPFNASIQQYVKGQPNDYDYFDFNDDGRGPRIMDTHYVGGRPPEGGPELNWSEGFDPESNPVITQICLTTVESARNIAIPGVTICNVLDNFSFAKAYASPPIRIKVSQFTFNQTGENMTYFGRMLSNDSSGLVSGFYDFNITIVNTRPRTPYNFTTPDLPFPSAPEAHLKRPWIEFMPDYNALDLDNGTSADHWPGDNVTFLVTVQNISGTRIYLNSTTQLDNSSHIDSSRWLIDLDYGILAGIDIVNATYNFTIVANDTANLNSSRYNGQFNLTDFIPDVQSVSMGDNISLISNCLLSGCTLIPIRHSNVTSLNVTVIARDKDADCVNPGPTDFRAYFHLCYNVPGGNCNELRLQHNFSYNLDKVSFIAPDLCKFNFTAYPGPNMIGPEGGTPSFFELGTNTTNIYRFYVNVTSQSNVKIPLGNDLEASGIWNYASLLDSGYINPSPNPPQGPFFETTNVTVGGSSIIPGSFSSGTKLYILYNFGNVIFDSAWNTTRFVRAGGAVGCTGPAVWTPSIDMTEPLLIDDDDSATDPETLGNLTAVIVPGETVVTNYYNFTTGIHRCDAYNCDNPNLNETIATYWHIKPVIGLCPGEYSAILNVIYSPFP